MTWKEFKEFVEEKDPEIDNKEIWYIDVTFPTLIDLVVKDEKSGLTIFN